MLEIIDTHAHLDMPEFDPDREEVIGRASASGVRAIVTVGINLESDRRAIELAEKYPHILAGIGIHPQEAGGIQRSDIEALLEMAANPRVVAIGETGLDFYRNGASQEDQMKALTWQLEAARSTGLPVVIHCRQAQEAILPVLESWAASFEPPEGKPPGILHCFQGDARIAETYLKMGFYLSLGAYIGYPSSAGLRELLKSLPLERLLIETDCPFLPPQKLRGKRNEPAYTLSTLAVLAGLKGVSEAETAAQTTRNALVLFPAAA